MHSSPPYSQSPSFIPQNTEFYSCYTLADTRATWHWISSHAATCCDTPDLVQPCLSCKLFSRSWILHNPLLEKKCFLHVKSVTHSQLVCRFKKTILQYVWNKQQQSEAVIHPTVFLGNKNYNKTSALHEVKSIVMIYSCIKVLDVILKQADFGANKGSPLLCSHGCCPECSCSPTCSACSSCTSGSLLSQVCCSNPTFPEGCTKGTFV